MKGNDKNLDVILIIDITRNSTSHGSWGVSSIACLAAAPGSNPASSNVIFRFIGKLILRHSTDQKINRPREGVINIIIRHPDVIMLSQMAVSEISKMMAII